MALSTARLCPNPLSMCALLTYSSQSDRCIGVAVGHGARSPVLMGQSPVEMLLRGIFASLVAVTLSLAAAVASPAATATVASRTKHASGCAPALLTYPGSRPTDCVALSNNTVFVDNTIVSAKWSLTADEFGFTNVCAIVSIRNQNKSRYFFNDFNMTLRPPKGSVTVLNFTAKHALEDGFIAPGGVARGNICFDYLGEVGQYVAMYSPRAFSSIRGIWLVNIK
ncbi:MAG TPA: hypothetical protein VGZ68_00960 [Acidimicrobiales bacterium]|nr:hypothetical protein [Acidimicrobiales bacterium]